MSIPPVLVPRFWVLVVRTILMKSRYRRLGDALYTDHLNEFYTRSQTPGVEVYGDAYGVVRSLVVELAAPVQGDTVLDMGTGGGYQAAAFASDGHSVVGMDYVYDRALLACEQHAHLSVAWGVADIEHLPFRSNAFDIVTITMALHDIPLERQASALSELRRVASRRVVIAEPRAPRAWLWHHLYAFLCELVDESLHIRTFVLSDIDSVFERAGLRVVNWRRAYYQVLAIYVCEPVDEA